MNYLYSQLCNEVENEQYKGSETDTTVVTVNQVTKTISVSVKSLSPSLLNVPVKTNPGNYILQETILEDGSTSYSWTTLEEYDESVTSKIDELNNKLQNEVKNIEASISNEETQRIAGDDSLYRKIEEEAENIENSINYKIGEVNSTISSMNSSINDSISSLSATTSSEINGLSDKYTSLSERLKETNTTIGIEIDNRIKACNEIEESLSNSISQEKEDRTANDQEIVNKIGMVSASLNESTNTLSSKISELENNAVSMDNRVSSIESTGVLKTSINGNGSISVGINSPAERIFNLDVVDISNADNDDRFTVTLNNNDSISGYMTDNTTSIPLVFVSKWNKVEVGGSGAPLNLNSDDGTVTVNDTLELLNNKDKSELENSDKHLWDIIPNGIFANSSISTSYSDNSVTLSYSSFEKSEEDSEDFLSYTFNEIPQSVIINSATASEAGLLSATDKQKIDNISSEIQEAVSTEESRAIEAEEQLQSNINAVNSNLTSEIQNREDADTNIVGGASEEYNTLGKIEGITKSLDSNVNAIEANINKNLLSSISISSSSEGSYIGYETYNPLTTATSNGNVQIPIVSNSNPGLVTPEQLNLIKNSLQMKGGEETQTINGNIVVAGNLTVNGTTVTENVESLTVNNALIITNSNGADIRSTLSGLAIKVNSDSAYGIVYEANVNAVVLGAGSIDDNGSFFFSEGEGYPVAVRDISTNFAQDHIISWDGTSKRLVDSGIDKGNIALLSGNDQTFENVITFTVSPIISENKISIGGKELVANTSGIIATENQVNNVIETLNILETSISNAESNILSVDNRVNGIINGATSITDFLKVENSISSINASINNKVDKIEGMGLSQENFTSEYKTKLAGIEEGAQKNTVISVASKTGEVILDSNDVGLGNVKNVDTTNANNITTGYLSLSRIETGLIENGENISVSVSNGAYTISANVPVKSVAGQVGDVQLKTLRFNGYSTGEYDGSQEININIPTVPTMYSVNISSNGGSDTIGKVFSENNTDIIIPEIDRITSVNKGSPPYGSGNAIVDISISTENGAVTITPVMGNIGIDDGNL